MGGRGTCTQGENGNIDRRCESEYEDEDGAEGLSDSGEHGERRSINEQREQLEAAAVEDKGITSGEKRARKMRFGCERIFEL